MRAQHTLHRAPRSIAALAAVALTAGLLTATGAQASPRSDNATPPVEIDLTLSRDRVLFGNTDRVAGVVQLQLPDGVELPPATRSLRIAGCAGDDCTDTAFDVALDAGGRGQFRLPSHFPRTGRVVADWDPWVYFEECRIEENCPEGLASSGITEQPLKVVARRSTTRLRVLTRSIARGQRARVRARVVAPGNRPVDIRGHLVLRRGGKAIARQRIPANSDRVTFRVGPLRAPGAVRLRAVYRPGRGAGADRAYASGARRSVSTVARVTVR